MEAVSRIKAPGSRTHKHKFASRALRTPAKLARLARLIFWSCFASNQQGAALL